VAAGKSSGARVNVRWTGVRFGSAGSRSWTLRWSGLEAIMDAARRESIVPKHPEQGLNGTFYGTATRTVNSITD
jgi:hypothetical protein